MNIAITGATGRLGSVLLHHFSQSPELKVFPVSRQSRDNFYANEALFSNDFLRQTDVILHLAWSSVPKISEEDFGGEWLVDLPFLTRLLRAIRSGAHNHIHFVFFSSAGTVYGKVGTGAASESSPCVPINMYGWSKLHAEQLLQQFATRFPIPLSILRISNVYGIGSRVNDQQGVIPLIIRAALNDSELNVWGNGEAVKDYLYIDDLITAVEMIVRERAAGLYNVGFGKSYSLLDIIRQVEKETGRSIRLQYAPAPAWDNDHVVIDANKLRRITGWKPAVDIDEGIVRVLDLMSGSDTQTKNGEN